MAEDWEVAVGRMSEQIKTMFNRIEKMDAKQDSMQKEMNKEFSAINTTLSNWRGLVFGAIFAAGVFGSIITLIIKAALKI